MSDTRRLVSKNNNTTSYHRPDPSSGTMLPEVIARLYEGARPWSSIAEDQGRGGSTGAGKGGEAQFATRVIAGPSFSGGAL